MRGWALVLAALAALLGFRARRVHIAVRVAGVRIPKPAVSRRGHGPHRWGSPPQGIVLAGRDQLGMSAHEVPPVTTPQYAAASGLLLSGARSWSEGDERMRGQARAGPRAPTGSSMASCLAQSRAQHVSDATLDVGTLNDMGFHSGLDNARTTRG